MECLEWNLHTPCDHRSRSIMIFPQGHSSFVTHLDWSKDSQYLVTNSGDYEILFCRSSLIVSLMLTCCTHHRRWWSISFSGEASTGKHVTNMDTVRNLEWATSTCTLSFNTFGRLIKLSHFSSKACGINKLITRLNYHNSCSFKYCAFEG